MPPNEVPASPLPSPGNTPNLPTPRLSMSPARANRLAWTVVVLALLGIVASALTSAGWIPVKAMQVCGTVAMICQGFTWYLARLMPSAGAIRAAQRNGHDQVSE